jgi:hypothetical protein
MPADKPGCWCWHPLLLQWRDCMFEHQFHNRNLVTPWWFNFYGFSYGFLYTLLSMVINQKFTAHQNTEFKLKPTNLLTAEIDNLGILFILVRPLHLLNLYKINDKRKFHIMLIAYSKSAHTTTILKTMRSVLKFTGHEWVKLIIRRYCTYKRNHNENYFLQTYSTKL